MKKYYLVDTDLTDINYIKCSDEDFMAESIKQKLCFSEEDFIDEFNLCGIDIDIHQLRIIKTEK